MQKKLLPLVIIAMIPIITACQDKEHSIVAIKTIDDDFAFVELNVDTLTNLLESNQEFILETYSPTCNHCEALEPILKKYSNNKDMIIYRFNALQFEDEDKFDELFRSKYPSIFTEYVVPTINFIKDKELTYHVSSNKFSSYTALSKILDKHFIQSEITMINSMSALETYASSHDKFIAFSYNLQDFSSLKLSNHYLITEENANAKKPIVLLNKESFAQNFAQIKDYFSSDYDNFASYIEKDKEIKTIDYSLDDGQSLSELLSNL